MIKIAKVFFGSLLGIYILVVIALYVMQRDLMFSTSSKRVLPADIGMEHIEEVSLVTADGANLYSWHGHAQTGKPTILYFHGNGGSVATRPNRFQQFMTHGYGVFILGYPGYGGSEGRPSEVALVDAARLSYSYLRDLNIESNDIVIFGESLGTSVAVQLAKEKHAKALILAAPMSSIREIAEMQYPFVPLGLLLKDPFMTIDYIRDVHLPLLVFHGSEDDAIPIASSRKLFDVANEPKIFHEIEGAGHNNLFDYPLVEIVHTYLEDFASEIEQ